MRLLHHCNTAKLSGAICCVGKHGWVNNRKLSACLALHWMGHNDSFGVVFWSSPLQLQLDVRGVGCWKPVGFHQPTPSTSILSKWTNSFKLMFWNSWKLFGHLVRAFYKKMYLATDHGAMSSERKTCWALWTPGHVFLRVLENLSVLLFRLAWIGPKFVWLTVQVRLEHIFLWWPSLTFDVSAWLLQ